MLGVAEMRNPSIGFPITLQVQNLHTELKTEERIVLYLVTTTGRMDF